MKNFNKGAKKQTNKKKDWDERTLLEAAAANWKMTDSFPVTLGLSVLNTENKWFIYVI